MNERKLTPEQIDELFAFCRQHYIYHYDVQLELVDHLASSIENYWETEPELSFQQAVNKTYKGFGIYGFNGIKSAKEKALRKKYNRLLWRFIGEFFKLPKIIMTIAITLILFVLLRFFSNDAYLIGIYFILFLPFGLLYHFYLFPKYFKINLIPGKSFLLTDYLIGLQRSMLLLLWVPLNVASYFDLFSKIKSDWIEFLIAFLITLISIVIYANCFYIPVKVQEHFTEQFPQFIQA